MKVKDLILYQIATDRHYKVGDELEFGKIYNFQGQRVFDVNYKMPNAENEMAEIVEIIE